MKALSLKQPFAELIVKGIKTIELRSWNTKHRGIFLIHASKSLPSMDDCKSFDLNPTNLDYGALIGVVELESVKHYEDSEEWHMDVKRHRAGEDYASSMYGFILKNPMKFTKPIPFKGKLNFFNVDENILNIKGVKP